MELRMTLRRLGQPVHEQKEVQQNAHDNQKLLIEQVKRFNDYLALMTNEPDPPTETDEPL